MSTLRNALNHIKENIIHTLFNESHLTFDELKSFRCFTNTSIIGIEGALEELEYEERVAKDSEGRYYLLPQIK